MSLLSILNDVHVLPSRCRPERRYEISAGKGAGSQRAPLARAKLEAIHSNIGRAWGEEKE